MPKVILTRCNGNLEVALRRLKRMCDKLGIQRKLRDMLEGHVKDTEKRRKDRAAASKRQKKQDAKELSNMKASRKMRKRRIVRKVTEVDA
jgi:ribosomal protein S21